MSEANQEVRLGPQLLYTPDDRHLQAADVLVSIYSDSPESAELRAVFVLNWNAYEQVSQARLFHLSPEARGPAFGGGFSKHADIEVETRLESACTQALLVQYGMLQKFVERLQKQSKDEPLCLTETYYALYVKQLRGRVKTGYVTRYAG